ncbi:MAG: hypothetical protein ACRDNY_12700 [Gaiellaceae bacterium]
MRRALLSASVVVATGAAAVAGLAAPETGSGPAPIAVAAPELPRLLGFDDQKLVGVDPETLRPVAGRRIPIGSGGCAPRMGGTACWTYAPWTVSPDATTLAVARNDATALQIVDPRRLRVTKTLPLKGEVGTLAWLTRTRILAVEELLGERQGLAVFDVAAGRIVARRPLGGSVARVERTADELVLLLAPARTIGTARLAVAGRRGALRFVRLQRIVAGSKLLGTGSQHRVDGRHPGFAVDPERRRAFVIDTAVVAEIDLRTLKVAYHSLERRRSVLARLHDWLEPVAAAKQVSGYHRAARWLGAGLLAVTGADTEQSRARPAGLLLVDTSSWDVRKIDAGIVGFDRAGDLLLARGIANGLTAYAFEGSERFRVFEDTNAWVAQVYAGRAYVSIPGQEQLQVIDLTDGRVVDVRKERLPRLLVGVGAGWWE